MTTRQTPDAVREALHKLQLEDDYATNKLSNAEWRPTRAHYAATRNQVRDVRAILAALDSRAGDAGEGLTIAQRAARIKFNGYGVWWHGLTDHQRQIASLDNAFLAGVTAALSATPAPAVDAQTLAQRFRDASRGLGRAGTAEWPGGPYMSMADAAAVYADLMQGGTGKGVIADEAAVDAVPAGEGVEEPDWLNAATCIENMQIAYDNAIEADPFDDGNPIPSDTVVDAGDLGVLIGLARYAAALSHGEGRK